MTKLKIILLGLAVLYGVGASAVHAGPAMPRPLKAEKAAQPAPAVRFADAGGIRHRHPAVDHSTATMLCHPATDHSTAEHGTGAPSLATYSVSLEMVVHWQSLPH